MGPRLAYLGHKLPDPVHQGIVGGPVVALASWQPAFGSCRSEPACAAAWPRLAWLL